MIVNAKKDLEKLAKRLRHVKSEFGLNNAQIASEVNLSRNNISLLLRNKLNDMLLSNYRNLCNFCTKKEAK